MKKFELMKMIDREIINYLDQFKEGPLVQKMMERYNVLEEHEQKLANLILMAIPFVLPLIMVLVIFIQVSSIQSELGQKKEIIERLSKIVAKKAQMRSYTSKIFGDGINTNQAFKAKITTTATRKGIDSSKIKILDFKTQKSFGINHMSARLSFKGFSDKNLYDLVQSLFVTESFQVSHLDIVKNQVNRLLNGQFEISLYNKESSKQ